MEKLNENTSKSSNWTFLLVLAGLVTTLGSSLPVGYNIGVINAPADIIKEFCIKSIHSRYNTDIDESGMNILWSFIVSIFIIGGVTGSFLGSLIADRIGRKGSMILANFFFILSAIFFLVSNGANSIELLIAGRLVVGLASGLATSIVPMYLTEISPIKLRGAMGVLCPLGVTFGVLVSQILGLQQILGSSDRWFYLLGLYGILTAASTPILFFLPESPKYLFVVKSNSTDGIKALSLIRNQTPDMISSEILELQSEAASKTESLGDNWTILRLMKTPGLRIPLLLVCFFQAGQQTSGINAVFYYSTDIFIRASLSDNAAKLATIGAGIVNCAMAVIAIPLNSKIGRRPLALFSTCTATLCLLCLCVTILLIEEVSWMPIVCIIAVLSYVLFYGLGLGPIPYFIGSELFEVGPRPAAMALGSLCNWGGNFLVGMTFPSLQTAIGAYSFLLFALSTGLLFLFLRLYFPETKGKSSREIATICENNLTLKPIHPFRR